MAIAGAVVICASLGLALLAGSLEAAETTDPTAKGLGWPAWAGLLGLLLGVMLMAAAGSNRSCPASRTEGGSTGDRDSFCREPDDEDFDSAFRKRWQTCARQASHLAVALVRIDHWAAIVDTFGQPEARSRLKQMQHSLSSLVECRGGLLFVTCTGTRPCLKILFPNTTPDGALADGEDLRMAVEDLGFDAVGGNAPVMTASIGIGIGAPEQHQDRQQLLKLARYKLDEAVRLGGNRVEAEILDPVAGFRG